MPGPLAVAGIAAAAVPIIGQVVGGVRSMIPRLEDEVTVTVVGQPGAKRKDLYYLALSAACSVVKRFDPAQWVAPPPGMLMLEYGLGTEEEDHFVRVTLRYRTSLMASSFAASAASAPAVAAAAVGLGPFANLAIANAGPVASFLRPLPLYGEAAIYAGPKDDLVGAPFTFTGAALPGIPSSARAVGAPQLPFENRTILTKDERVRDPNPAITDPASAPLVDASNPKPAGDNRSRGSVPRVDSVNNVVETLLVPLVHAVISNPASAYMQTFPPPTDGPTGG